MDTKFPKKKEKKYWQSPSTYAIIHHPSLTSSSFLIFIFIINHTVIFTGAVPPPFRNPMNHHLPPLPYETLQKHLSIETMWKNENSLVYHRRFAKKKKFFLFYSSSSLSSYPHFLFFFCINSHQHLIPCAHIVSYHRRPAAFIYINTYYYCYYYDYVCKVRYYIQILTKLMYMYVSSRCVYVLLYVMCITLSGCMSHSHRMHLSVCKQIHIRILIIIF